MKINLEDLSQETYFADFIIQKGHSEKLDEAFEITHGGIRCSFEIRKSFDKYFFRGFIKGHVHKPCDYCLEKAGFELDNEFGLTFILDSQPVSGSESGEIAFADTETELLEGLELDVSAYFEEQIFLETPFVLLCDESCKGLCSQCGANLNTTPCNCERKINESNNPFSLIKIT